MLPRPVGRAGILASAAILLFSGSAFADSVGADGDIVASGIQNLVDLGTVSPGASINHDVSMTLSCTGLRHVDPGQVVTVSQSGSVVPAAGGSISATATTLGPVPPTWANDTAGIAGCSAPMSIVSAVPSHVTIVAPATPGTGYAFTVAYGRSLAPAGVADASSVSTFIAVTFILAVEDRDSTPPSFDAAPPDIETTTSDPAGAVVDYALPTATDDRDPRPLVGCDPAPGSTFPVGITSVTCTATDASGNTAQASFGVIVHLADVAWEDPVGNPDVVATRGRSLPIKVRAWLDGTPLSGDASLFVTGCDGVTTDSTLSVDATWQDDASRWMAVLDTSGLALGCHRVELVTNGLAVGSFNLEIVAPPKTTSGAGARRNRPS